MNSTELETLIRTILSEQLTPAQEKQESGTKGIFATPAEAIDAAHQAFLRYQQCLSRAMTFIKIHFVGLIKSLGADVGKRLAEQVRRSEPLRT